MSKMLREELEKLRFIVKEKLKDISTTLDKSLEKLFKKRMAFMLIVYGKSEKEDLTAFYISNMSNDEQKLDCLDKTIEMVKNPVSSNDDFTTTIH